MKKGETAYVECPKEKKVPTVTGRCPDAMRRRVIRSMADMWSASKAWRRPSVYERTAVEIKAGWKCRTIPTAAHAKALAITRATMMLTAGNGSFRMPGVRVWMATTFLWMVFLTSGSPILLNGH